MPPPSPSQKVQGAVARDTPGRDLREPPWDVLRYGSLHLLRRAGGRASDPQGFLSTTHRGGWTKIQELAPRSRSRAEMLSELGSSLGHHVIPLDPT